MVVMTSLRMGPACRQLTRLLSQSAGSLVNMGFSEGFSPLHSQHCRVLILGSMPGQISLKRQQYYAHSRNVFWKIMSDVLHFPTESTYDSAVKILLNNRIALWDVMQCCFRPGSLDSAITEKSVVPNNFERFYSACPQITVVFFNGQKARDTYMKHVIPTLSDKHQKIDSQLLPSTSPAYAAMTYANKYKQWKVISNYL